MKKPLLMVGWLIALILLTACGRAETGKEPDVSTAAGASAETTAASKGTDPKDGDAEEAAGERTTEIDQKTEPETGEAGESKHQGADENADESITPTQYLCYLLGNAEEYALTYETELDGERYVYEHYYKDGQTAVVFEAEDINGKRVGVRVVEKDDRAYYVIPGKNKVVSYRAPAPDILVHELQQLCMNAPVRDYEEQDSHIYLYEVPFAQDETITIVYAMTMTGGTLRGLKINYEGADPAYTQSFVFSEASFDPVEPALFEIPGDLEVTEIDAELYPDEISPWFE